MNQFGFHNDSLICPKCGGEASTKLVGDEIFASCDYCGFGSANWEDFETENISVDAIE